MNQNEILEQQRRAMALDCALRVPNQLSTESVLASAKVFYDFMANPVAKEA